MDRPTPRVNYSQLSDFAGRTVRIVGKVLNADAETATIETSDKGHATIKLSRNTDFSGEYVEILGKVNASDNSIQEYSTCAPFLSALDASEQKLTYVDKSRVDLGSNIDMDVVEQFTLLSHQYSDLFPGDNE
ncbi:DNA replication factor A subunit Ssb3 [Pseudohyphozyma bogoriensis]|nr:DNA replication factor A subunit Ssb3 [Pseudohyphozyma bogoriensis]